jgi:putative transposase
MLLFLRYRLICGLLRLLLRAGVDERELETVVLRHQLKILRRGGTRPRFTDADRAFLAAAARLLSRDRWKSFLVGPDTLGRWRRQLWRRRGYRSRRLGRPPLDSSIKQLILRLGRENPRWGYLRIRGELLKLGVDVSATTIATVLRQGGLGPAPRRIGPTWTQFLRLQAYGLLSPGGPSEEEDTLNRIPSDRRGPPAPSEDPGTAETADPIHAANHLRAPNRIATGGAHAHASPSLAPARAGARARDGPAVAA